MTNRGIPSAPPPAGPCPWLVYFHGEGYKKQTFCCNISGPPPIPTYCMTIPALHDKKVLSCSYGWLVLYNGNNKPLSLCNCSTFDTITLPRLKLLTSEKNRIKIDSCVLMSSPDSPDCKVLLFPQNIQSIMCYRIGDKEWSEMEYGEQLKGLDRLYTNPQNIYRTTNPQNIYRTLHLCQPVTCGGKLFARIGLNTFRYHNLILIDIVEAETMRVVLSQPCPHQRLVKSEHSRHSEVFMVESCGKLFSLLFWEGGIILRDILAVEVFRLNSITMMWERQKSVENTSFFICPNYSMSCRSTGRGFIYFTRSSDSSLYCYSMEDESLSMSLPVPYLAKSLFSPIWMMPKHLISLQDWCNGESEAGTLDLEEIIQEDLREEGQLCNLPFDILREVTKHLTPLDYMNFRGVSRIFRQLAPSVNWRKPLTNSKTKFSFPLLMFPENEKSLYKFIDPRINNNDSYLMKIPENLEDTTVQYSNYGSLLLSRGHNAHLYNPFTKAISSYTWLDISEKSLFFSLRPSVGSSITLISISFCYGDHILVSIHYPGANHWSRQSFRNTMEFEPTHKSPVLFKDAYYFLSQSGILGRFKLEDNNCSWDVLDKPQAYGFSFHHSFLVECGGDLLAIFVARMGKLVVVCKLDQSENVWEPITSLNNYSLYLCRTSCFSLVASPGLENRIYFPRFRGRRIVFYSLETGKWHVSGTEDSYTDFYGTRLLLGSCWIQPSWC